MSEDAKSKATRLGREQGSNAAEWAMAPDRMTKGQMLRTLRGIEAGDPQIMDNFREPSLSGEWVDNMTPSKLMAEIGLEGDNGQAVDTDEICEVWEEAARDAFWNKIQEILKLHIKED